MPAHDQHAARAVDRNLGIVDGKEQQLPDPPGLAREGLHAGEEADEGIEVNGGEQIERRDEDEIEAGTAQEKIARLNEEFDKYAV